MKTTPYIVSAAAALVLAVGLLVGVQSSASPPEPGVSAEQTLATAKFAVENMSCATCPITVKKAMSRVPGVRTVEVDFDKKIATVTYDPAVATPDAIAAASTNAGYPARVAN